MMGTDTYTDPGINVLYMKATLENMVQSIGKLEKKVQDLVSFVEGFFTYKAFENS